MGLQTQILAPVVPHMAEEAWELLGREGMVIDSSLPEPAEADDKALRAMAGEQLLVSTMEDIREILKITGIEAKLVRLYTSPRWKQVVHAAAVDLHKEGGLDMGPLMNRAMADADVKAHSKTVPPFAQKLVKELPRTSPDILERILALQDEAAFLEENRAFLEHEVGSSVEIVIADSPDLVDPANKARHAVPGRVAIYVE